MNSGYVALIGRTNVGKSTFLNGILQSKVSIVSNKPQTTRRQILGIKSSPKGQIIFFDSPGIHKPQFKLNEKMMKDVYSSMQDADLILYFLEVDDTRKDEFIISMLENLKKKTFLVINKIDKYKKSKSLDRINEAKDMFPWAEIIPISALEKINTDLLENLIYENLPEGEFFYPEGEITLQTEYFYVSEMIREKILNLTRDELPFTTSVKIEEIKDKGRVMYVRAVIMVETRSQKKIVVGKQGQMIKEIGEMARKDLEDYYDRKVFLELFVKIVSNWRNSSIILQEIFD